MLVWFITGASRGFGRLLTAAALADGDSVIAAARNPQAVRDAFPDGDDSLLAVPLDVGDPRQAVEAVASGVERFDRIDVVVNNAGYGLFGDVEEISDAQARALFDTNVFGLLNVTRAVLRTSRSQGAGRILNMGSQRWNRRRRGPRHSRHRGGTRFVPDGLPHRGQQKYCGRSGFESRRHGRNTIDRHRDQCRAPTRRPREAVAAI